MSTQHKIGHHNGDILPSPFLGFVLKTKSNTTKANMHASVTKYNTTQDEHKQLVTSHESCLEMECTRRASSGRSR